MDFLNTKLGTIRRSSSKHGSSLSGLIQIKPKAPRDIYWLYNDEFGFAPKKATHLMQFAKQKHNYILKFKKAEELLNDPPKPPKERTDNGYEWSSSDESSSNDIDDDDDKSDSSDDDNKNQISNQEGRTRTVGGSIYEQSNTKSSSDKFKISDFDKLKRTQLIKIGDLPLVSSMSKYVLPTSRSEVSRQESLMNIDEITDNSLNDDCGYSIIPLTNNIIIDFHLDIPTKQWPKVSRTFLKAINDLLKIKRRDYNILTVAKHEKQRVESRISFLIRKFNHKWPDPQENLNGLKIKIDNVLAPLKRTFKDSGHLLKMLKKLQFANIDTGGKNQVERKEFDAYFNATSVEPLDPQVLTNLFNTLDADGDGEITALEFFKWKTTFSQTKLTSMFPIISYRVCDDYKNCEIPRLRAGLFEMQQHLNKHIQDFPFELNLDHIYYVSNGNKYNKYQSFNGFKQSKLLFLVHKTGVGDLNINNILKNAIGKKGKYFDDKGIYGQGYYLTSHVQYALNDIFFGETSEFKDKNNNNNNTNQSSNNLIPKPTKHQREISAMDKSYSTDLSHGEYTLMACLVNPGKINYLNDYSRGKKIKSSDSNYIQHIIGDWNSQLFGCPESYFNQQENIESNQYYKGSIYDCYVVKNHERILPRYILTFNRIRQCFIWMDEKYGSIKESAEKLIAARRKLKQFMPNVIYGGDNVDKVIKTIRLKMKYNSIFLLRFVGMDVNVNTTMGAFIKYIRGNIKGIKIKIYPITIIYNVNTKKQLWNLILRDDKNKKCTNVRGSAQQIFKYIRDNLGGIKKKNIGSVSVLVISIKFVKSQKEVKSVIKQQIEDAKSLEQQFENGEYDNIEESDDLDYKYEDYHDDDNDDDDSQVLDKKPKKMAKPFKIKITGADGGDNDDEKKTAREINEEEEMKEMLDEEKIDKLLSLDLPSEVSDILGNPLSYKLPLEEKDSMKNLERDMRKMHQGLHDQSRNQRKYSKLAILKHYNCLCAVYDRYCKLGGDRHWLTMDGYMWMLKDASIPNKDSTCTNETCKQLFSITYKMHHRLQSRHSSKHKIKLSTLYGDDKFHDPDPWTGIWKQDGNMGSSSPRSSSPRSSTPRTPKSPRGEIDANTYKLRKIGDLRIAGCINSKSYADISGAFHSLNYKKSELEIKYHQRRRAGVKRIWKAELIAPKNITDSIRMKVQWTEIDEKARGSQAKSGKLWLEKISGLDDNDIDLPKDELIGLSRHEFFDTILSIASTKYEIDYEYQFICIDKLLTTHINAYLYKNILLSLSNTIENNQYIKNKLREKNLTLRKLFKIYASLDQDESADDDGLGQDEWCTFATKLCETGKNLNKKIWINGGKPTFSDMKAAFILSKTNIELDEDEVDYPHFQRCILHLTNMIFKEKPDAKYKTLSFEEKLDLVLSWTEKLSKQRATSRARDSSTLKKIRNKSSTPTGTRKQNKTPKNTGSNNNSIDQFQFPATNNSLKLKE